MADINEVITLGLGTPASIKHFITLGLDIGAPLTLDIYTASVFCNPSPTAMVNANPTPAQEVEIG